MKRDIHFHLICITGFSMFMGSCNNREVSNNQQKPNVIFIAIDDLNDWLGCMNGHPNAITPNLDRAASQGVLFTNAYCQAPLSGPSRASLMTGLRPSTTGIYGMIHDNEIKDVIPNTTFLPEYFKNNGYFTMGIGKLFHEHAPDGLFDESGGRVKGFGPLPEERFVWDGYGTADTSKYGRTSTDWGAYPEHDSLMPDYQSATWAIERLQKDSNSDQPFFLAVGFLRPHVPFYAPQKWFDMHPVENLEMPPYKEDDLNDVPEIALEMDDWAMMPSTEWAIENDEWANIVQAYLACVSFVDHQVGRIINALENSKYTDNTVVVIWSDHGYRLGEKGTFAKMCLWEEAAIAPLIFMAPGLPEGEVINDPVEILSVYPTLLELCGLPSYEHNEGESLVSLMKNGNTSGDEKVALTTFGMNNHTVRSSQYRYIQYEDGSEELYDHSNDPNEWYNLADNEDYNEIKQQLIQHLPEVNVPWAEQSEYTFNPYFVNQKKRILGDQ